MNIHFWSEEEFQALKAQLTRIETTVSNIAKQENIIMSEIDDLVAEVTDIKGVEDSGTATITRMADQINTLVQNATDLAALKQQIAAQTQALKDNAAPLAAAIAANPDPTPAAAAPTDPAPTPPTP